MSQDRGNMLAQPASAQPNFDRCDPQSGDGYNLLSTSGSRGQQSNGRNLLVEQADDHDSDVR